QSAFEKLSVHGARNQRNPIHRSPLYCRRCAAVVKRFLPNCGYARRLVCLGLQPNPPAPFPEREGGADVVFHRKSGGPLPGFFPETETTSPPSLSGKGGQGG